MDNFLKAVIPVASVVASFFFGGWSALLTILLVFVVLDYITGVAAAAKEGKLKSNIGLWGIARKMVIFAIVAVAHLTDQALGGSHLFRDAAIFFYLANELLSLIENAGRLDAPIPPGLKQAVEVLKGKSGDKGVGQ
ncbi:phage holin family protein [Paenibacillus crassostreae]|uniref:Holin n=1 Tax=Paenibacillus crassostreae TaxID=1763538 RepID=A0A167C5Q0_9BACL|nr:phage holin family protein [Paenibacillus crassostreae]AOZ91617.1 holin [Paenibacillus crassostreae]OAB72809.1 holin [Paenibacillus crassostreae]